MEFRIQGNISGNVAEVDQNNNLYVNNPQAVGNAGYLALGTKLTDNPYATPGVAGTSLGSRVDVSNEYRLRLAYETIMFQDQFSGSAINTNNWSQAFTTFTIAVVNGLVTLGTSAAANCAALINTYKAFPLYRDAGVRTDFSFQTASVPAPGTIIEMGFGIGNSSTAAPTDGGAFFRFNQNGEIMAVVTRNSIETQAIIPPSVWDPLPNTRYRLSVVLDSENATFYLNSVCIAQITPVYDANTTVSPYTRLFFRINNVNDGMAGRVPQAISIGQVCVTLDSLGFGRPYPAALSVMGMGGTGQTGGTQGTEANWANSAAPVSTAFVAAGTGAYANLGGQFQGQAAGSAETDMVVFGFQVQQAAVSAVVPGKTFYITGIHIESYVFGAATATSNTLIEWGLGVGSTSLSLATTEGVGTKIARRLPLGFQWAPSGDPVGYSFQGPINMYFPSPIPVEGGSWIQIFMKQIVSTATASLTYRGEVAINGYYE